MSNNNQRLSVQAGYCGDASGKTNPCVLKQSDCNEGDAWQSSRQMDGSPYSGHGGYCLWSSTVKDDIVGNQEFGACQNASGDMRCSYAADHCVEGEESWVFPVSDCSCDKVRVGGCEKDGKIFCAATEDGCDDTATWMDALTVSAQTATDCYLCITKTTAAPIAAPVEAPLAAPVVMVSPTNAPVVATQTVKGGLASTDEGSDNLMAAAIGGAVGGVLLLILATAFFVNLSRKRKANKADAAAAAPPTKNLETSVMADTVSNLDEEEFQARGKSDFV